MFRTIRNLCLITCVTAAGCATGPGTLPPSFAVTPPADSNSSALRHYYVDGSLKTDPCPAYDPASRRCGTGADLAFNNLRDAGSMARAGDTIEIRAGRYPDPIMPESSGSPTAPVVFRGFPGEDAVITVTDAPALQLRSVQYVKIEGLRFDSSLGWGRLEEAHHNQIVGNTFTEALARGTTGGLKLVRSHYNVIGDNTFYRGNDNIVIQDSGHNLVAGNHIESARHSLISIRCSNYNIIRSNYFHNQRQKAAEIYDCEGVSDAPVKYDFTKRNVFEYNHFAHVTGSSEPDNHNGIQYSAQAGIVRHNWFIDNQGGAIHLAIYPEEALYIYGNRIYGNRFIGNRCHAISVGNLPPLRAGDNRIQGNLFSGNLDCLGGGTRVDRHPVHTLVDNLDTGDSSAALPASWLARTLTAGSGTVIALDDVLPFSDGHGIDGEQGDGLVFEYSAERAQVRAVDFTAKTLTLDHPVSWHAGEGVRNLPAPIARPERTRRPFPHPEQAKGNSQ